jgi:hypothetical protein
MKKIFTFITFCLTLNFVQAWNPFASKSEFEDVQLSSNELKLVNFNAGWSKDNEKILLFEIRNQLKGPIQCSGAQVELTDGSHVSKGFMPKLFVPSENSRFASVPGILKGTMKSYVVGCSCFKKLGKGDCLNPLDKH